MTILWTTLIASAVWLLILLGWRRASQQRAVEEHRLEGERWQTLERLELILRNMPLGCIVNDAAFRFAWWNPTAERMFGYAFSEVAGKLPFDIITPSTARPLVEGIFQRLKTTTEPVTANGENITRDGRTLICEWSNMPLRGPDGSFLGLVSLCQDVSQRVQAEEQLRHSLEEKEALLREVHHRVKNNLQVISSLLHLQASRVQDPGARQALVESQNRVRSMALVHENLYSSASLARIDFATHLKSLCAHLLRSFGVGPERVRLVMDLEPVRLDVEKALPCGLIANELVSNALKYAFPDGRTGQILIAFHVEPGEICRLVVKDDGVGLPASMDLTRPKTLGLQLVGDLTRQLGGNLDLDHASGLAITVTFPGVMKTAHTTP